MFAGVSASSSTPYGYEFYGNQPLAWYDASLADSYDADGSDKVSAWRSRWTGKVPTEDWTLTQGTASKQPIIYSSALTNRAGGDCLSSGTIKFYEGSTTTFLVGGNDTDRHIDSVLFLIAQYQPGYGVSNILLAQEGSSGDWDDDSAWWYLNINDASPKENRIIWAYASSTSFKYMTNWSPGTYDANDNPGVYYDHIGCGRIPSDTNKPSLFMKDLVKKNSTAYAKDSDVFGPLRLGANYAEHRPFRGYIAEVIMFDATEAEFSNTQVSALSLQMAKRHNVDSTNNASGLGY